MGGCCGGWGGDEGCVVVWPGWVEVVVVGGQVSLAGGGGAVVEPGPVGVGSAHLGGGSETDGSALKYRYQPCVHCSQSLALHQR